MGRNPAPSASRFNASLTFTPAPLLGGCPGRSPTPARSCGLDLSCAVPRFHVWQSPVEFPSGDAGKEKNPPKGGDSFPAF